MKAFGVLGKCQKKVLYRGENPIRRGKSSYRIFRQTSYRETILLCSITGIINLSHRSSFMKLLFSGFFLTTLLNNAWAVKLSDYSPYIFEPLFTNPVCEEYEGKPKNVYCKQSDEAASIARKNAPQYRLKEWITDKNTKELYLAYLSFSNKNIAKALCEAVGRGVKLSMVLDAGEERELNKDAEGLKKCGRSGLVDVTYRGSTGGLGFAHNKIMIVNPTAKVVKIVFSSGNMSSGTSTNHENWNFVTTSGESYFAQAHKCVVEGMIEAGDTRKNFSNFLNECRGKIGAGPESDIEVFFSPVDGDEAFARVEEAARKAQLIEGISHRLSGKVAGLLGDLLEEGKKVRLLLDDDMYWAMKLRKDVGRNTSIEAFKIFKELINKGAETKFLETNEKIFQLQHNKFFVFSFSRGGAVFNGAGNMTTAAFTKNFENFYYIQIPEVVEAYKKQYAKYFDEMATAEADMPQDYVLP